MVRNDKKPKSEAFVEAVIKNLQGPDTSFGAMLRRADNPVTEYKSWHYLYRWCDVGDSRKFKPYALIGAALARAKPQVNGRVGIGQAILLCYSTEGTFDGVDQPAALIKLRRLFECASGEEACVILRPLLSLINSRQVRLDYADLLKDLLVSPDYFNAHIRVKWARDYYYKREEP